MLAIHRLNFFGAVWRKPTGESMACCNQLPSSYTVRRYDQDGRTLWTRDFFRDSNWLNPYFAVLRPVWPLRVAASPDRVYVGGPLIGHQFGSTFQSQWSLVVYDALTGARLARRNVWDDILTLIPASPSFPATAGQYNIADICFGQNGQIGVLTASSQAYLQDSSIAGGITQQQVIALYSQDLTIQFATIITPPLGGEFEQIEIDAAGLVHLAHETSELALGLPDFQRVCIALSAGELIGCVYPDASLSALTHYLPLRHEHGASIVDWQVPISDFAQSQEVLDIGLAANGDILAAGTGFAKLPITYGVWGRFTSTGAPLYVGKLTGSASAGRIAGASDRYYVSAASPTIFCRNEDNSHRWAHKHQPLEDLYPINSGGIVTVGERATVGVAELNFMTESQL